MADDIMTIDEVAEYLRINMKTAYRLAGEDKLPGFKVGGAWRFRRAEIETWIDNEARASNKKKGA